MGAQNPGHPSNMFPPSGYATAGDYGLESANISNQSGNIPRMLNSIIKTF